MIEDERMLLPLHSADVPADMPVEATRAVTREVDEATRLREPDAQSTVLAPARTHAPAPPSGIDGSETRPARVPHAETDHGAYGVRRDALTVPVVRTPATSAPAAAAPVRPPSRRRPRVVGWTLGIGAAVLAACAILLVLLVIS